MIQKELIVVGGKNGKDLLCTRQEFITGDCWHLWGWDNASMLLVLTFGTLSIIQSFKCSLAYLKLLVIFHSARKEHGEWSLGGRRKIRKPKVAGCGNIFVRVFLFVLFPISDSTFKCICLR